MSGHVFTLFVQDGLVFDFTQRDNEIRVNGGTLDQVASFAVDSQGRLYAIGLDGEIHRLTPQDDEPEAQRSGDGDTFLDDLGEAVEGMVEAVPRLIDSLGDLF